VGIDFQIVVEAKLLSYPKFVSSSRDIQPSRSYSLRLSSFVYQVKAAFGSVQNILSAM
jgi:hypothetical protein